MKASTSLMNLIAVAVPLMTTAQLRGSSLSSRWPNSDSHNRDLQVNNLVDTRTFISTAFADRNEYGNACGGILVAPDVVLTAARCQVAFEPGMEVAVAGVTEGRTDVNGTEHRKIEGNLIVHPNWDRGSSYNLMLFKIESVQSSSLKPIPLNTDINFPKEGHVLKAIRIDQEVKDGGASNKYFRMVDLKVVTNEECYAEVQGDDRSPSGPGTFDESIMCAESVPGDSFFGGCNGDQGTALFDPTTGVLVGVTGRSQSCSLTRVPTVFGDVATNAKWIQDTICALSDTTPTFCPP